MPLLLVFGVEHGQQTGLHVIHGRCQVDGDTVEVAVDMVLEQTPDQIHHRGLLVLLVKDNGVGGFKGELPLLVITGYPSRVKTRLMQSRATRICW